MSSMHDRQSRENQRRNRFSLREAVRTDAARIHELASLSSVERLESLEKGFLLFPFPADEYEFLIDDGHPIAIMHSREDENDVVGFVCGLLVGHLDRFYDRCVFGSTVQLLQRIEAAANERDESNAVIVYQMALAPEWQGRGYGVGCFRQYIDRVSSPFYGVVMTKPLSSPRLAFWRSVGFHEIGTTTLVLPPIRTEGQACSATETEWTWSVMRRAPVSSR